MSARTLEGRAMDADELDAADVQRYSRAVEVADLALTNGIHAAQELAPGWAGKDRVTFACAHMLTSAIAYAAERLAGRAAATAVALSAQGLASEAQAAMRVAHYLARSTGEAHSVLCTRLHHGTAPPPAGALALFEAWECLHEDATLRMAGLEEAARYLFAGLAAGRHDSGAKVAHHLQLLPGMLAGLEGAWQAFRGACQSAPELVAACDAYAARRDAQAQAEASACDALHRLVLELAKDHT